MMDCRAARPPAGLLELSDDWISIGSAWGSVVNVHLPSEKELLYSYRECGRQLATRHQLLQDLPQLQTASFRASFPSRGSLQLVAEQRRVERPR